MAVTVAFAVEFVVGAQVTGIGDHRADLYAIKEMSTLTYDVMILVHHIYSIFIYDILHYIMYNIHIYILYYRQENVEMRWHFDESMMKT